MDHSSIKGWIGVDLDGTLAHYEHWLGPEHIGEPIPAMVDRVKIWLAAGIEVRIMTSRVGSVYPDQVEINICAIKKWCMEVFGTTLPITNEKDQHMMVLWDDRVVQVFTNTGKTNLIHKCHDPTCLVRKATL